MINFNRKLWILFVCVYIWGWGGGYKYFFLKRVCDQNNWIISEGRLTWQKNLGKRLKMLMPKYSRIFCIFQFSMLPGNDSFVSYHVLSWNGYMWIRLRKKVGSDTVAFWRAASSLVPPAPIAKVKLPDEAAKVPQWSLNEGSISAELALLKPRCPRYLLLVRFG